jgi:hypothetical protein
MSMTNVKLGTVDLKTGVAPIIGFDDPTKPGGFISAGTEGGRTLGDKLVTIEFDGGGKLAIVFVHTWAEKKDRKGIVIPGEFEYIPFTIKPNTVFCTNTSFSSAF